MDQFWVAAQGSDGDPLGPMSADEVDQGIKDARWTREVLACPVGGSEWQAWSSIRIARSATPREQVAGLLRGLEARVRGSSVVREPGGLVAVVTTPGRIIDRALDLVRRLMPEARIDRISGAVGWIGLAAVLVGGAFAMVFVAAWGFEKEEVRWILPWIGVIAVVASFLQFLAMRFAVECDKTVRAARHPYSRTGVFDVLGISLLVFGSFVFVVAVREAIDKPRDLDEQIPWMIFGGACFLVGCLFLNPRTLGLVPVRSTSVGQDGLAFLFGITMATMRSSRLAMGILCFFGAILSTLGSLTYAFGDNKAAGTAWFWLGVGLLTFGAMAPFLAFLGAMLNCILLEVLDSIISQRRGSHAASDPSPAKPEI